MTPPPDVIMTVTGGRETTGAVRRAGALVGQRSSEPGPPNSVPVEFVDYPFNDPSTKWMNHLAMVRRRQPKYAVAPDVQEDRDLEHAIELADRLDEYADTVIMVPKTVRPSEIPSRFRVGLPFQPDFGPGGLTLEREEQTTLLDYGQNRLEHFRDVGPVHVLGGSPHDQLRLQDLGIEIGSVDSAKPLTSARYGRVWFRQWELEMPQYSLYERLEASLRNILRAWGHRVDPLIDEDDVPEQMRRILEADDRDQRLEEMRYMQSGGRGAPPLYGADEAQEPMIEQFWEHRYTVPDPY